MPQTAYFYEDLAVGDTFETRGRTITESHLVTHAGNTGDMNELQMNEAFAKETRFGERAVHAPLTYSMMEGLITSDFRHENSNICYYGLDKMRIPNPTFIGDTITVSREIIATEDREDGGIVTFKDEVTTDDDRVVLVCETLEYIRTRE